MDGRRSSLWSNLSRFCYPEWKICRKGSGSVCWIWGIVCPHQVRSNSDGNKAHEYVKPGTTNSQPSDHQKNYRGEKPHVCSERGKAFSWRAQLIGQRDLKAERNATAVMNVGKHYEEDSAHGAPEDSHEREAP